VSQLLSPLDAFHREDGAVLIDFAGWRLPARFGSDLAEHRAVRTGAGLFDLSHMAQIDISGHGAGEGLDYALMGKPSAMVLGRASYSMLLTEQGTVIDDLIVYRLADNRYFIIANAANRQVVVRELTQRLDHFGLKPADLTPGRALVAVQGPGSLAIMQAAGFDHAAALGYYRAVESVFEGTEVVLARTGYTGENGFEVALPAPAAPALWQALVQAGQSDLVKCGLACRDSLRLEAGMPLYGHELDLETTPIEAGQGWLLRQDKGEYVGGAALAAAKPTKHLVGLVGQGRRAAREGSAVLTNGQVVGRVTSGALSPTLGYPIAMAFIAGEQPNPGDSYQIDIRGHQAQYEVVKLPFYTKEKP